MRIENREMKEFLEFARRAESTNLKSLTDLERKTLLAMSRAIRKGKSALETPIQEGTLNSIRVKLTEKQEVKGSSFFGKIIKFFMNLIGLRTSSDALKVDIDASSKFLTKNLTKLENVEKNLKEKMNSLDRLTLQEGSKESISKLRKEIGALSKEKSRLESLVFPMEEKAKAFYEEKKEALSRFRSEIPGIIHEVKARVPAEAFKEQLMDKLSSVETEENEFSEQFQKDYTRTGFKLKLRDPSKGEFVGFSKPKETTSPSDYFEYHQAGFNQFFLKNEKTWKLFVQEMVTQTPINILMSPLMMQMSIDQDSGALRTIKVSDNEIPLIFDVTNSERNIDVLIKRDQDGSIIAAEIKILLETPVQTGKYYPGQSTPRPIDTIGYVESTLSYTLVYNEDSRDIQDLKYNQVLRSEEPKKIEEDAGFFPAKKIAHKEEKALAKIIKEFELTLQRIKFDQIPTLEKIALIEAEIESMETARGSAHTQTDNDLLDITIGRYRSYLEALQKN